VTTPTTTRCGLVVYAKDLRVVAAFYERVLDLAVVEADDAYVVLERGPVEVVVLAAPPDIVAEVEVATPPLPREATPLKPVFHVVDLARARAAVEANGGVAKAPSTEWTFRDARVLDGWDPEGNVLQLRSP
jgi:predicted enzyme related to lactoylglutathione lyase